MKRLLLPSPAFLRAARRIAKRSPPLTEDLRAALELLAEDVHDSRLRTHKLKGRLEGSWACSAGYFRIIFSFVEQEGTEAILLETVGTHDEVY